VNRRPSDYTPFLRAEWQLMFPRRPHKEHFSDEVLCAVQFFMRQIDPDGRKPVIGPPAHADGVEPCVTAKSRPKGSQ
jgi:hypothetical protein